MGEDVNERIRPTARFNEAGYCNEMDGIGEYDRPPSGGRIRSFASRFVRAVPKRGKLGDMQGTSMKYQLSSMVLINAGTNKHVPSGRISAIDPRGGAAVLGDNGVGKTTTLRILPLFFGHLPSQIVSTGQGQEPMVRFVLPTDASAIAFEYQRGSDSEADMRLVVIRRRADDRDVPFYRLYKCKFLKELFVEGNRFLSDDETQLKANELKIQTTPKLSTAEYRSVILRTPAMSKDKEKLRRYSIEWSFGPKQLDNMDRLVAAMVKKHIVFDDIVQVAVGLVQQDLGHGAERSAKLTYRQGKEPIQRWLKNRAACADAFKLAPRVKELEDDLKAHRTAEARFRARRADVVAVTAARVSERTAIAEAIAIMTAARADALEAKTTAREVLLQAATQANSVAGSAKVAYDEQDALAEYFEAQRAKHWSKEVQDLPSRRMRKQSLDQQVSAADVTHAEATAKYMRMEQDIRSRTGERATALEKEKQPHRDQLTLTLSQIAAAEEDARKQAESLQAGRVRQLDETLEPLVAERGSWEARKNAPAAPDVAIEEQAKAGERLQAHTEAKATAGQDLSRAEADITVARLAFSRHEDSIRSAKAASAAAAASVENARQMLTPDPFTLLAALRGHSDDVWKRTLGKVINPALLSRDDLAPVALEDAAQTIYGWQLNTGAITAPDWVDDIQAKKALEAAEERATAAQAQLLNLQDTLTGKSRALKDAEQAQAVAQASFAVLDSQTGTLKTTQATAKLRVESEKRDAIALASAEIDRLTREIEAVKTQLVSVRSQLASELTAIKKDNDLLRSQAKRLQDDAIAATDASIERNDAELRTSLTAIAAQLTEHLSAQGVDVERLAALKAEAAAVAQEVLAREEKEPMVNRWRVWVDAGGTSRVESLRKTALHAMETSRQRAAEVTTFDQQAARETAVYEAALTVKTKRRDEVDDDIAILAALDEDFGDYSAFGEPAVDLHIPAKELKGAVKADRAALDKLEESIRTRFLALRQDLTGNENSVRDLVDASLARVSGSSDILRAAELCTCYKLIGPQVANDVNLTLKTLLTNIGAFQKAIDSFDKEVSSFNRRLQNGLSEVRCFERIKDLRLDIVTNFENLGFYKKLRLMETVVRQHASEFGKDYTRELPPIETAQALGEFINVLGSDGSLEVNLSHQITLKGSVTDNGQTKEFKRASELENISSEGLTSLILITLMTALLNTIRGPEPVHVPWVTDEVGKFDPKNFLALMRMLQENLIDVVTASPELGAVQQGMFARRYMFEDKGLIREYLPREDNAAPALHLATLEVQS